MKTWMDDFLTRCLAGVPQGTYRGRAERELRDHLAALERDLEGAGYPPEEARTLALERMGDPAQLAGRYAAEWKRRSWQRRLLPAELLLLSLCVSGAGVLYIINTRNFGKSLVGYWGIAAIAANLLVIHGICGFLTEKWNTIRFCSLLLGVFQLPPLFCWVFYRMSFLMSGVWVPAWTGFSVHLLFLVWSAVNCYWCTKLERENAAMRSIA